MQLERTSLAEVVRRGEQGPGLDKCPPQDSFLLRCSKGQLHLHRLRPPRREQAVDCRRVEACSACKTQETHVHSHRSDPRAASTSKLYSYTFAVQNVCSPNIFRQKLPKKGAGLIRLY